MSTVGDFVAPTGAGTGLRSATSAERNIDSSKITKP